MDNFVRISALRYPMLLLLLCFLPMKLRPSIVYKPEYCGLLVYFCMLSVDGRMRLMVLS